MVEKRQQERRQQDRRQQDRRQLDAELVAEIRAAAPGIPLERAEAVAIGIRRDCGGDRANIRK